MAIYQRNRNFQNLFSEIDIDVIPLKFIRDVTCYLSNGSEIVIDADELKTADYDGNHLESLIRNLDFYPDMTDLQIRINYDRVEHDVHSEVEKILNNCKK